MNQIEKVKAELGVLTKKYPDLYFIVFPKETKATDLFKDR